MKKFLTVFLFTICSAFVFAQDLPKEAEPDKPEEKPVATFASYQNAVKQVSFAKPFDLTLSLQKPAKVIMPEESDFELISLNDQDPLNIVLTLVPFNLGASTFTATLADNQGQEFALPPLSLEIKKVKTKYEGKKLLDIRGPYKPSSWLFYLLLALLILAALIYFVYYMKKREQNKLVKKVYNPYLDKTKTPEEVALFQIDSLLLKDIWTNGQYKLFYIYLTDILRDYLTARFGFEAHKFTTKDLLRYIKKRQDFNAQTITPLEIFLKSSDFVKFAKAVPTLEQRERNISDLRLVITENALPKPQEKQLKEEKK